ncbi:antibiotic resistance protein mcbg [Anaeramoeba ignava]|uniref:Antibiotic resistance protein mcbg n=1 Tax=Anaeramoeba ignava TaxID=1746090 RepID=A0A9Q0LP73_ANAIG|nr:antibiotic resistance protein mcbg [Anaeramoeba ignava]
MKKKIKKIKNPLFIFKRKISTKFYSKSSRIQNFEFIDCLFGPSTYFNTNFENCKFDGSRFEQVIFIAPSMMRPKLENCSFENVEFVNVDFPNNVPFKNQNFKGRCEINNICIPEEQFKSNFKGAKVTNLIDISKDKTKIKEIKEWNEVQSDIDKWKQYKDQK